MASKDFFYESSTGKGQRGVTDPPGKSASTVGLLVRAAGLVTDADGSFVFLNDGSWSDRTGIRVLRANLPGSLQPGDYVSLVGISSIRKAAPYYQLIIRPRRPSDVEVVAPVAFKTQ